MSATDEQHDEQLESSDDEPGQANIASLPATVRGRGRGRGRRQRRGQGRGHRRGQGHEQHVIQNDPHANPDELLRKNGKVTICIKFLFIIEKCFV